MNAPVEFPRAADPVGAEAARLLSLQQSAFRGDMMPSRQVRVARLDKLVRMVEREMDGFCDAIAADFGVRDRLVTLISDVNPVFAAARHAKKHLGGWMKTRSARVEMSWLPGRARIMMQPLGVVGIIGPWNYPLQLTLCPLVGALAAGNRAILKPSEFTPAFSAKLKAAIAATFPEEEVAVVTGGPEVGKAFADLPFDHLVFTGSTPVGRLVAQAAARNLTPVTLELGGKSPVIVDSSADLATTADRLAWGKLFNSGQTCIAPDYALVPRAMMDDFVAALRTSAGKQYRSIAGNPDYTAIISPRHLQRLERLVASAREEGATVVDLSGDGEAKPGNEVTAASARVMPPTVLLDVTPDMAVMQEEIFGPVLPVIPYDTLEDAIGFVNDRDRPLALYWFGKDEASREKVLANTISGGVSINETLAHVVQENLPFGGVGASGQGQYHGEYGFRTFSKAKPIFIQSRFSGVSMVYPPYTGATRRIVAMIRRFS